MSLLQSQLNFGVRRTGDIVLADNTNANHFVEWASFIAEENAKQAFRYMVGAAACSDKYACHPQFKGQNGPVKDFRFSNTAGEQEFSFITNKSWLLFYFRAPAQRSGRFTSSDLKQHFPSFKENPAGEWTVKLRTVQDAVELSKYINL